MDNFWIGRFVRITNQYNDNFHERGQVVDHHAGLLTIRYATGKHAMAGTGTVMMDADQQTQVWPPVATGTTDVSKPSAFVDVQGPAGVRRGKVIGWTDGYAFYRVDVLFARDQVESIERYWLALSTDQTTPLDGGA